jgi:hypothetical protein
VSFHLAGVGELATRIYDFNKPSCLLVCDKVQCVHLTSGHAAALPLAQVLSAGFSLISASPGRCYIVSPFSTSFSV